jgi:hypothetical protein
VARFAQCRCWSQDGNSCYRKTTKRDDAVECGPYARESEIAGESEAARDDEIDLPGPLHA